MTIYHYIGYYIGSLIVLLRKGDRPPNDPATFLEDLQQAGVRLY
jgi:hypothetical protein